MRINWMCDSDPEELIKCFELPKALEEDEFSFSYDFQSIASAITTRQTDRYRDDSFENEFTSDMITSKVTHNDMGRPTHDTLQCETDRWGTVWVIMIDEVKWLERREKAYGIAKMLSFTMPSHRFGNDYVASLDITGAIPYNDTIDKTEKGSQYSRDDVNLDHVINEWSKYSAALFARAHVMDHKIDEHGDGIFIDVYPHRNDPEKTNDHMQQVLTNGMYSFQEQILELCWLRARDIAVFMLGTTDHENNYVEEVPGLEKTFKKVIRETPFSFGEPSVLSNGLEYAYEIGWPWRSVETHPGFQFS